MFDFIPATRKLCSKGGFQLHKVASNSKEVIESVPKEDVATTLKSLDVREQNLPLENAVGVQWCLESDSLLFRINIQDKPLTRRILMKLKRSSEYQPHEKAEASVAAKPEMKKRNPTPLSSAKPVAHSRSRWQHNG